MFNRNKDINSIILMNLDDEDLERICKDPAYKNVYGNDMFWRQRTINRFASTFEALSEERNETEISILEKYSKLYSKSWKEYYLSLMNFMEHIYANEENMVEHYIKG